MKVRLEMEIDMNSGVYDVLLHNLSRPGDDIDVHALSSIVQRVLEDVANKGSKEAEEVPRPRERKYDKAN